MKKKYPWDLWFSSGRFVVRENIDYTCLTFTMNSQIRKIAVTRGIKVSIHHSRSESGGDILNVTVRGNHANYT